VSPEVRAAPGSAGSSDSTRLAAATPRSGGSEALRQVSASAAHAAAHPTPFTRRLPMTDQSALRDAPKKSGGFFAVDINQFKRAAVIGLEPAVAYLALMAGTETDQHGLLLGN
jgi:hypothetical protein